MTWWFLPSEAVVRKFRTTAHHGRGKVKKTKYDDEEQELLASFEKGEWQSVKNVKEEKLLAQRTAAKSLQKDADDMIDKLGLK